MDPKTILFVCAEPLIPVSRGGANRLFMMIRHLRAAGFRVDLTAIHHGRENNAVLRAYVDNLWTLGHSADGAAVAEAPERRAFSLLKRPSRPLLPRALLSFWHPPALMAAHRAFPAALAGIARESGLYPVAPKSVSARQAGIIRAAADQSRPKRVRPPHCAACQRGCRHRAVHLDRTCAGRPSAERAEDS